MARERHQAKMDAMERVGEEGSPSPIATEKKREEEGKYYVHGESVFIQTRFSFLRRGAGRTRGSTVFHYIPGLLPCLQWDGQERAGAVCSPASL